MPFFDLSFTASYGLLRCFASDLNNRPKTIDARDESWNMVAASRNNIWRLVSRREDIIIPLSTNGKGVPIFFVHSIGGDLTGYDSLVASLGLNYAAYGIQVPRSMMTGCAASSIETISARYVDALARLRPIGPLILAGYSAGAVIALEMAQQLRCRGREIPLLISFDGAPSNSGAGFSPRSLQYLWHLTKNIPWRILCVRLRDLSPASLRWRANFRRNISAHRIGRDDAVEYGAISDVADRSGWTKEQRSFMRIMCEAMIAYIPRPYEGPVILYEVKAQPFLRLLQYGAIWRKLSPSCEIYKVAFTRHSDFFASRYGLKRIVKHLRVALEEVNEAYRNE